MARKGGAVIADALYQGLGVWVSSRLEFVERLLAIGGARVRGLRVATRKRLGIQIVRPSNLGPLPMEKRPWQAGPRAVRGGMNAACLLFASGLNVAFAEEPVQREDVLSAEEVAYPGGAEDEQRLDYDDFSVPDDASFEPLWDAAAYPDLQFTAPGCGLDVVAGRRVNELGPSWFVGAFLALPLGGRCLGSSRGPAVSSDAWAIRPSAISLRTEGDEGPADASSPVPREAPQSRATLPETPAIQAGKPSAAAGAKDYSTPSFVAELVRRIGKQSGAELHLSRLDKLARQERASGLLPEVRLRGAHGVDESLALDTVGSFSGEATSRGGSDSVVEARLTFHLDRLLSPQSSTSLERLRQSVVENQEQKVELGLELLATVSEAEALLTLEELTDAERIKHLTRGRAARTRLHVLTGGWFPLVAAVPLAK